jgi:hypothetical protein
VEPTPKLGEDAGFISIEVSGGTEIVVFDPHATIPKINDAINPMIIKLPVHWRFILFMVIFLLSNICSGNLMKLG